MSPFKKCLALFCTGISGAFSAPVDNLVSYWDFENNVNDQATVGGTFDNGTWVGTAGFTAGKYGQAIFLDGSNYVSINSSADMDRAGSDMSLSTWFQVAAWDTGWQCLVAKGEGSFWRIARQGGDANAISFAGGTGDIFGGSVNDAQWHHLVAISEA